MKGQARPYGSQTHHHGKSPKVSSAPRSKLALVISRMADGLDLDLLEAALGVSAQTLKDILTGRGREQEVRYAAHIWHQVQAVNLPAGWLKDASAPLPPESLASLRALAAQSNNKSAIRKYNFKVLAESFEGRLDVLADALEIVEQSVTEIASGVLPIDDHRFGHINPRLVSAGFPDGWLDQPAAVVTDELVANLTEQADEEYDESSFDDEESVIEVVNEQARMVEIDVSVAAKAVPTHEPSIKAEVDHNGSAQSGADAQEVCLINETSSQKEIAMKTPRGAKTSPVDPALTKPQFKAAGIPGMAGATLPLQSQAGGAKPTIPRGALATGRILGKPLSAASQSKPQAETLSPTEAKPPSKQAKQPRAVASQQAREMPATADGEIREISMRRAAALEQLLESARRGAKVTLWRDLLKSSLGYWGNIRRGQVFLRDQLANDITTALGLPEGWLDNPVFPPPALADWVMDANVPLPGTAAPAPALAPARVPSAAKTKGPKVGATTLTASATLQPPATQAAPAPQAPAPTQAAPAPAPAPAPVQQAAPTASGVGVDWQPAATAQPVEKLGPIVTALVSVIQDLGLQGKLTEQEALKLLNGFMAKS